MVKYYDAFGEPTGSKKSAFVKSSDYAALEAQLAALEAENLRLQNEWDNCDEMLQACRSRLSALEATPPAPKVTEAQAELIRRVVMPMVGERSREVGDAWDNVYHVLDALTAAQEAGKP